MRELLNWNQRKIGRNQDQGLIMDEKRWREADIKKVFMKKRISALALNRLLGFQ